MVAPVSSLMSSLESIFNNQNLADNDYVYVKGSQAQTENSSRLYTTRSRKMKTAERVVSEIRSRYGAAAGDVLSRQLASYLSGNHQLKVGELRRAFQTAQAMRLNEIALSLRQQYGDGLGNALAPLYDQIAERRLVSARDVAEAVQRQVGEGAYAVAMASGRGVHVSDRLDALPERLTEVQQTVDRLNASAAGVRTAMMAFCRRGEMTRAGALAVVQAQRELPQKYQEELNEQLQRLPATGVTVDEAFRFFGRVNFLWKQAAYDDYIAQQPDPVLCRMTGIIHLQDRATELTQSVRQEIEAKMAAARPAAQPWLDIVAKVRSDAQQRGFVISELFDEAAAQMVKEAVRHSAPDEASLKTFKEAVETRLKRETDFDFGVEYEIRQHAWTPQQKALFREAMTYARDEMPRENLFFGFGNVASTVVELIKEGAAGTSDPSTYLKACVLAGLRQAPWVREKLPELTSLYQRTGGRPPLADFCTALFGERAAAPDKSKGLKAVNAAFEKHWSTLCERLLEDEGGWVIPQRFDGDMDPRQLVWNAASMGMKLEKAVAQFKDQSRRIDQSDFYKMPGSGFECSKKDSVLEASLVQDFSRQKTVGGRLGQVVINIDQGDGTGTRITNGTEGMTAEEAAKFANGVRGPKHEKLFAALRRLSGGHPEQYRRLVEHLTQVGAAFGMKALVQIVNGGRDSGGEHAPFEYHFTKEADGSVVLECHTPEQLPVAKISAQYVFSPEGDVQCTRWQLTPYNEPQPAAPNA